MKCRKCGADLLDTDTFCVKCGQRVEGPMFCSSCGEQLRDGERFCHKCGAPVESGTEDDEIPVSRQNTVDIPFDQIEQGILLEAKQAIVKRPEPVREEHYRPEQKRDAGYDEEYVMPERSQRRTPPQSPAPPQRRTPPPRPRRMEDYDDYDDYDNYETDDDDEDSGGSKMKVVTIILGIAVVAVGLLIGFTFWQKNRTPDYGEPGDTTGQDGAQDGEDDSGLSADTSGRIQILSNVNVRNKPTTEDSEVMMVAKTGETYEYYELVDDAWYHIKLEDGKDGYVSAKYVEDLK